MGGRDNLTADDAIAAGFPPAMTSGLSPYDIETLARVFHDRGGLATVDSIHKLCARGLLMRVGSIFPEKTMGLGELVSNFGLCKNARSEIIAWAEARAQRLKPVEEGGS